MTSFWLPAAAMAALALAFIVLPLLRNRRPDDINRDRLNVAVIREQLAELKADVDVGKLDPEAYEAARHDLERELLDDVDSEEQAVEIPHRSGRWMLAILLPAIPLLAVLLYQQLGTGDFSARASQAGAPPGGSTGGAPEDHNLNRMLEQLAQRLREEPDHPEGWILLGRSYASMRRYNDAVAAYEQARKYGGDTPELLIDFADTLIAADGGKFSEAVGAMLEQALKQQPDNAKGLWLIGHWYYQQGNFSGALDSWQRVATQLPPGSENAIVLQQQIELTRAKLGDAAPTGTAPATDTGTGKASIQVTVSLDPALRDSTAPDDTLFIFARAVSGPRMPLAIVRKQVRDLPVTVTLDDSMAMSPAMVLSRFPQVSVGARISKTGQALPTPGDLQGMQGPVSTKGTMDKISVVINEQVGSKDTP